MTILEQSSLTKEGIEKAILRYGYAPEHNMYWYGYSQEPKYQSFFVTWPDNTALLTYLDKNEEFYIFSEPLAPENIGGSRIVEFIEYAFRKFPIKKIWLELRAPIRQQVLRLLPPNFRASAINYTLTWPVMNMELFDSELPGKRWKSIRNARNKFYREHEVTIEDARRVPKNDLHELVERWAKRRPAKDRAYTHSFHSIIDAGFIGTKTAQAFIVDGQACGINSGWEIPNSDYYYAAIGLHDYSHQDLGIVWYLEDLLLFKKMGFKYVDMAGGEKALTGFKNQFQPEFSYKTFVFSVVKK